jgi:DNA-directed RNA polymerase subunit RPC12/RpoP
MKALHKSDLLFCPYGKCGKGFAKPLLLTDSSSILRETYYACPHCQSKLDIIVENLHVIRVEKCEGGERVATPLDCPHAFGYLKTLHEDAAIPDECLVCPKILQCSVRK